MSVWLTDESDGAKIKVRRLSIRSAIQSAVKPEKAAEWRAKLPTEQDPVASDPPAEEKQEE